MKRILSVLLIALVLICTNVSAEKPITVDVDYLAINFDTNPVNIDGRVLVPVRAIFEAMGASVSWNAQTQTVSSKLDGSTIVMVIGQSTMKINGESILIDVPPQIIDGRTLVPVRAVSEALNARVKWIPEENKVSITTEDFLKKLRDIDYHSSQKTLSCQDGTTRESYFEISYLPTYDIKTDAPDGTDFEIVSAGNDYCAILGIRSDIYHGTETQLTEEYARHIAEDMVTLTGGSLISSDITSINKIPYMKIHYTAPGAAEGIYDENSDVTTYMAFSDGVVYTMTLSTFGNVPFSVLSDLGYMAATLDIG